MPRDQRPALLIAIAETAIALIGMPIVIAYTAFVYWQFRGKTVVDEQHGY